MARRGENIYKRKDGRWEGRYKCGFTSDGKAKYHSVYGHSYAEVKTKLAPLEIAATTVTTSCHLTVKTLFDEWLSAVKLRVKSSTYANYQMKIEKHILPAFSGLHYESLTVQMLHAFIDDRVISYTREWNCQEMCSQRIPKILDRQESGSVMSEPS